MKFFLEQLLAIFLVLCIFFTPLNFDGKCFQFEITQFIFLDLIQFIQNNFFENPIKSIDFSSDTIGLNLLILILFFISITIGLILKIIKFRNQNIIQLSRIIVIYYLAYILLKYGFDKIFKSQFYLPEPNILYSQVGDLSKDILYWSTIGTSRFYSISLGIIEVFTAFLLLINRTRILGLLIAIGVFANVILVNFGFDISVKTFSVLLLLMTLFAIFPELKNLFVFFIKRKEVQLSNANFYLIKQKPIRNAIKTFVIGLMFLQIFNPYFKSQNFNDDSISRPFLHGVYNVIESNQKTVNFKINRFFIHRKKYLILENEKGNQVDYYFELNQSKKQLMLIDYNSKIQIINYNYSTKDSILQLYFPDFKITAKAQYWRNLKVLKNDFHWTIDEIK